MADTTQTIRSFYERAMEREFLRDVNFRLIEINFGENSSVQFGEDDLVYARSGKLPTRSIQNVEAKYMGLTFNLPGTVTYDGSSDYAIQMYCDENCILRDKIEKATRDLFDDTDSTGNYFIPKQGSYMTLAVLDKKLNVIKTIKLVGCSIRKYDIEDFKMSEGKGDIIQITMHIAYHYYEDVK